LVDRFSLWSGAAGLIPVPLIDIVAVGGVQLQMLRKLSELYGVPFTDNRGKSVVASLAGALIPASTATTTAMTFSSVIKGIPGIGSVVGALTMPVYSAGATYVIGRVFMKHFTSGGTLSISIRRTIESSSKPSRRGSSAVYADRRPRDHWSLRAAAAGP
jgi:uncharacterized protein (DUF697 family)